MADEVNYLDLIVLRKMDAESTVEKFGTTINTSFFETANILGTMKIKGLVDIHSSIAGHSPVVISGEGQDYLASAMQKASEPLDALDRAILGAIAAGMRDLNSLQQALNIRARDLALHLHKLKMQDYIDHEIRSARVNLSLTEKGFILAGSSPWRAQDGMISPATGAVPGAVSGSGANAGSSASNAAVGAASASPASSSPARAASVSSSVRSAADDIEDLLRGIGRPPKSVPANANPVSPASSISLPVSPTPAQKADSSTAASRGLMGLEGAKPVADSPESVYLNAPKPHNASNASPHAAHLSSHSNHAGGKPHLDKTAMKLSKLEYYVKAYLPYAILLFLLLVLIAYAVMTGMTGRLMAQ